jgi:hypothetical protein
VGTGSGSDTFHIQDPSPAGVMLSLSAVQRPMAVQPETRMQPPELLDGVPTVCLLTALPLVHHSCTKESLVQEFCMGCTKDATRELTTWIDKPPQRLETLQPARKPLLSGAAPGGTRYSMSLFVGRAADTDRLINKITRSPAPVARRFAARLASESPLWRNTLKPRSHRTAFSPHPLP